VNYHVAELRKTGLSLLEYNFICNKHTNTQFLRILYARNSIHNATFRKEQKQVSNKSYIAHNVKDISKTVMSLDEVSE